MNYGKYNTNCYTCCSYLLIFNELSCIDQENQLPIITNIINMITLNFNVVLHGLHLFLNCNEKYILIYLVTMATSKGQGNSPNLVFSKTLSK